MLVSLVSVQILVHLDWFSHSITMEVWKPAQWKTAKFHWNKHSPGGILPGEASWTLFDNSCNKQKFGITSQINLLIFLIKDAVAVADLRRMPPARAPLYSNLFLISCSFWEILTKSYVVAPLKGQRPLLQRILDLPWLVNTSVNYWIIHPKTINFSAWLIVE